MVDRLLATMVKYVPKGRLTSLGHFSASRPWARKVLLALSNRLMRGPQPIPYGAGRGLMFQNAGSQIGYSLGTTEPLVQDALTHHLRAGMVVYDLGCNVGFFAVIMARLVGSNGRVVAFDPLPAHIEACAHNARLNALENVTTVTAAVGAVSEMREFQITRLATASHLAREGAARPLEYVRSEMVRVMTIDEYVYDQGNQPPDFIKMDVEGEEINAIEGMRKTLNEYRPTLLCEVHGQSKQMADALAELGYTATVLESNTPLKDAPWGVHIIAMPTAPAHGR